MTSMSADASKKALVAGIFGPAISAGVCIGLAIVAVDRHYTNSIVIDTLLAGMMLYVSLSGCKRVMERLP